MPLAVLDRRSIEPADLQSVALERGGASHCTRLRLLATHLCIQQRGVLVRQVRLGATRLWWQSLSRVTAGSTTQT